MKRTLAPEALYSSHSFGLYHSEPADIPAMEHAAERIRQIDPDGKKALALMKSMGREEPAGQE